LTRLSWGTASNKAAEKTIRVSEITELKYGQITAVFQKSKLPEYEVFYSYLYHVTCHSLQAFSFSAMYSDKSLDIVCANREEFDVWTTALQVGTYMVLHIISLVPSCRLLLMATMMQMLYKRQVQEYLGQSLVL